MNPSFLFYMPAWVVALGIFIGMIAFNWLGYRYRKMQIRKNPEDVDTMGTMEGSVLGLMGLMVAFSFGMAASKFENRRAVIIEEANNIGTAMHMSYLYSDTVRDMFISNFKEYIEARIDYYEAANDENQIRAAIKKARLYSTRLLKLAIQESKDPGSIVRSARMIPSLNSMIDIVTTREAGRKSKTPPLILFVLLLLILSSGFLVGYGDKAKKRNYWMIAGFACMITLTVYLIMDLDRPRRGMVNLDAAVKNIEDLRTELLENKLAGD